MYSEETVGVKFAHCFQLLWKIVEVKTSGIFWHWGILSRFSSTGSGYQRWHRTSGEVANGVQMDLCLIELSGRIQSISETQARLQTSLGKYASAVKPVLEYEVSGYIAIHANQSLDLTKKGATIVIETLPFRGPLCHG